MFFRTSLGIALALSLVAACNGEADPLPRGTVTVLATDAPIDHSLVEDARVWVDRVRIHAQTDGATGFYTLYEGAPVELDLDDLRSGLTATIVEADLPAGTYKQLRLRVTDALLDLTNGNLYTTTDDTLELTGQGASGFKVLLDPPLEVLDGVERNLVLDFDLPKTFLPTPASDPRTATSYELLPVIRTAVLELSGEFEGSVVGDLGGGLVPVADATLYLLPPGETDTGESLATTATAADGSFVLLGVAPGTYDVLATLGALTDRVDGVQVIEGALTEVDLTLE